MRESVIMWVPARDFRDEGELRCRMKKKTVAEENSSTRAAKGWRRAQKRLEL